MATKKAKSGKKATSKAKATTKPKAAAKKTAKKTVKKPKTLFGKLAQVSAQLVLDSGLLGEAPKRSSKRAPAKKRARKA